MITDAFPIRLLRRLVLPGPYAKGEGETFGYALDLASDATWQAALEAVTIRFPFVGNGVPAPDDALDAQALLRNEVRGIGATSNEFAAQIQGSLFDAKRRGNPFMLMKKLLQYCRNNFDVQVIINQGYRYFRLANGTEGRTAAPSWNWDTNFGTPSTQWSGRFWVLLYPNGYWNKTQVYNDGSDYGDGKVYGGTFRRQDVDAIRKIIRICKPAHTVCVDTIVAFSTVDFAFSSAVSVTPAIAKGYDPLTGLGTRTTLNAAFLGEVR